MRWPWRRRIGRTGGTESRSGDAAGSPAAGDALLARALAWAPGAAAGAPVAKAVEDVTARLVAEDLPRNAWLDGGVWAWAAYRGTATAALRAHRLSLIGDEAP